MLNRHPLDPLSSDEITNSVAFLKSEKNLSSDFRFAYVGLEEPTQQALERHEQGEPIDRVVFFGLLNRNKNETFEAKVNLTRNELLSWNKLPFDQYPYGQLPLLSEENDICERVVKANGDWRAAMTKRGLSNLEIDKLQIDAFSTGYFDSEDVKGKRVVRAIAYYREREVDNGYARPIEGVVALVDLAKQEIIRLDDDGKLTPIPKEPHNYDRDSIHPKRQAPAPLDIVQPEGPGFQVDGWQVTWENWRFRISFNLREGLVLHTISYQDQDRDRSIIHRASVTEMVVPYADPTLSQYFKAAFDSGDSGFGRSANQLELGCDCLGQIYYFDVPIVNEDGNPQTLKHAICMHEEDASILWKHYEHRTGVIETRRARELVVSFFTTIDNYDYGFYWRFCQDGGLRLEVKLTGIVQTAAIYPGMSYEWGGKLTPELVAPTHQHLFNARLHMSVDGPNNAIGESEFCRLPISDINPQGIAFGVNKTVFHTEQEAAREANAGTQRSWSVFNPSFLNKVGNPTAYKIEIPQTPLLLADPSSSIYKRAGFATKALWVTQYDPSQKYASGDYPNQHAGGDGLPKYIEQNRPIFDKPIVVWAVFGATHLPRPEDFPVMPAAKVMVELKPFGFFSQNPAMGLPPEKNKKSVKQAEGACCCAPEVEETAPEPRRQSLTQ